MLLLNTLSVSASGVSNISDVIDTEICNTGGDISNFGTQNFWNSTQGNREKVESSNTYNQFEDLSGYYETNFPFQIGEGTVNPDEYYYYDLEISNVNQYWSYIPQTKSGSSWVTGSRLYNQSSPSSVVRYTIENFKVFDDNGKIVSDDFLSSNGNYKYCGYIRGIDLLNGDTNNNRLVLPVHVSWDLLKTFDRIYSSDTTVRPLMNSSNFSDGAYYYLVPTYSCSLYSIKNAFKYSIGGTTVTDTGTQKELNTLNETEQDTNETTHSIFDSISDFFGSFFSNLIGVFVPEDGFFTTWFNNLNTLLTQKLGVLYYPFSVVISLLNTLQSAFDTSQSNSCVIYFPEISLPMNGQRYVIVERTAIELNDYNVPIYNADTSNSSMFGLTSLIWAIRRFNNFIIIFAIIKLFTKKLNLIMRGSEEG